MSRKWWLAGAMMLLVAPLVGSAQSAADSATYRRAQVLVSDGNIGAGRALVDSMIARATAGTNDYAEGLYWRAVLSATAADAEMDYRRIVVDYPLSPRVEDVLLRLSQLELARADYDGALQHLNRLMLEHPASSTRARAGYWTARVLFEKNDIQRACTANAEALAQTSDNDAELRNQISYLNQRCAGVALVTVPSSSAGDSAAKPQQSPSVPVTSVPTNAPTATPPVTQPTIPPASKPPVQVPPTQRETKSTVVEASKKEATPVKPAAPTKNPPAGSATGAGSYSVQVAAYNVKSQAEAMVAKLRKMGYESRVDGGSAPFRVRIGRYATQSQASAVMRSLKAKQIDGFVVKADSR